MERITRIIRMEKAFRRAEAALAEKRYDLPEFEMLDEYMSSGLWQCDYEADENGLIPGDVERGVLSQDLLYDVLCAWEEGRKSDKPVIHIFGASGSGTTTLASVLSKRLDFYHMDTDHYYWLPTDPMFTEKRPVPERIRLMNADIDASGNGAVISGSLTGWGDPLIPRFTLVVRVVTDAQTRIERLTKREFQRFGQRILEGGDMYAQHLEFLEWAGRYDTGGMNMRSKQTHDAWQSVLPCPAIEVNGEEDPEINAERIIKVFLQIAGYKNAPSQ